MKFKKGDRVRLSKEGRANGFGVGNRGIRFEYGTVTSAKPGRTLISVQPDGHKNPTRWHQDYWEPITEAAP